MDLIACGRVGRPHGVRGELRFWPLNPDSEMIVAGRSVRLGRSPTQVADYRLETVRRDGKGWVVRVEGMADRDAAAELTNATWFEPRDAFPTPADDEVYVLDLIGLPMRTEGGRDIGKIVDVWQVGAADVLVIQGPEGEHLVPNVPAFVVRLDPAQQVGIIRPIEGLLGGGADD